MYNIVENKDISPKPMDEKYVDASTIEIHSGPERTYSSGEICIEGWCSFSSDWSVQTHGEYETFEEA
jgi:hypothetical protein